MKIRNALLLSLSLTTAAQANEAAELWTAKCKSCHGPDGRAQTQMGKKEAIVDMTQAAWQKAQTNDDIREVIAEGSSRNKKMKAYKDKLTPRQLDSLVTYIRGFK